MTHNVHPISTDPPLPASPKRRGRRRSVAALVGLAAVGALPFFAVGLLAGGLMESPSARSTLFTLTAVSSNAAVSLLLGLHASRLHTDTRDQLRQLRDVVVTLAREGGYAVGYVDGRLGKPPRDGGGTGRVPLRPVQ